MTTPTHPEELLAKYVDSSLAGDEQAAVDAHLAGCERCRAEVALARRARTALSGLPELEVPPGTVRPGLRRVSRDRFRGASWVAGAAAASIAAIVSIVLLNSGGGTNPSSPAAAPRVAARSSPGVQHSSTNYDAAGIIRLADSLAGREAEKRGNSTAPGGGTGSGGLAGSQTASHATLSVGAFEALRRSPAACIRHGAGLPGSVKPIRPIIAARFEGTPVYVGAAVEGTEFRVWVVARRSCSVLFLASRTLG